MRRPASRRERRPARRGRKGRVRRACRRGRCRGADRSARRRSAARRCRPRAASALRIAAPRGGWRGTMMVTSPGWRCAEKLMRGGDDLLLALVGARRDPYRAVAEERLERRHRGRVGGRRRDVEFEIAGDRDLARRRAAGSVRRPPRVCARQRPIREKSDAGGAAEAVPAAKGPLRHARIDEDLRDAGAGELHDRHRPQLGLDEERDIRPPVAEEAADPGRDVDRRELVHGAARQAARGDLGGGDGDRGEDDRGAGARRCGRSSGITALVSPTLAACTQARRPAGRGREARP